MKPSDTSESKKSSKIPINRGVELILNGVKKPKQLLDLDFAQKFRFFKKELSIKFKFSFDVRKQKV